MTMKTRVSIAASVTIASVLALSPLHTFAKAQGVATVSSTASTSSISVHPQSSVGAVVQSTKLKSKIMNKIATLDVGHTFDLVEGEVFEGVNAAIRYRYQVEPSYKGDFTLRADRWTVDVDLKPGDLMRDFGGALVGLNINKGSEILFVRPFKSRKDAFTALPYTPDRVPFSAQSAIDRLEVGDFVSFTSKLNLIVSAKAVSAAINVPASFETHYLVSGEFQVHVTKAAQDKFRLKLFAIRKKEFGGSASVGFSFGNDFKVFGLRVIGKRIEKILDVTEIFKVASSRSKSNVLMVDYMMNLKDERVSQAYDNVLKSVLQLEIVGVTNPFATNTDLTSRLVSDITPFESIFASERLKPQKERILDRLFKGKNDVDESVRSSSRFSLLLRHFESESMYAENAMTSVNEDETKSYFRLHTFNRRKDKGWLFNWGKEESISSASILFGADSNLAIDDIRDISFQWELRDRSMSNSEFKGVQDSIRQNFPDEIYQKINWGSAPQISDLGVTRVLMRTVLQPSVFSVLSGMSKERIKQRFERYLRSIPAPTADSADPFDDPMNYPMVRSIEDKYSYDINLVIVPTLERVFRKSNEISNEERSKAFANLRNSPLFIEVGPGFLISILPKALLAKLVYFEVRVDSEKASKIEFEDGTLSDRKIFDTANYIQSVLNNSDSDLAILSAEMAR